MTAHQKCPWNRFAHPSPDVDCNYLCPIVIHLSFIFQTRQFTNSLRFLHLSDLPMQVILAGRLDPRKVCINSVHKPWLRKRSAGFYAHRKSGVSKDVRFWPWKSFS